ncbi:uncharacterized protein K12H4.2 [Coccinella septempunctata]|uniref:uncharacterized protein K12H4.2 n=1 Tax=Coccinella septempunctata TaxID=41139 RepID=UPI001D0818D8|nr:uncharacterized protein K12H4.2 [Coccinella septempunctata]
MSFIRSMLFRCNKISRCILHVETTSVNFSRYLKLDCISRISKDDNYDKSLHSKYEIFKDDSEVVSDIYDENKNTYYGYDLPENDEEDSDRYQGLNLERGSTGVFEIEDLVDVLRRENALDIFVAKIPEGINYADFICVVSVKSSRHMHAVSQFVRRVYKMKKNKNDIVPKLEGASSKDWQALDLGNIALHIFSKEARERYDLDSLWSVGPKMDVEYNKIDPLVEMLEKNTYYLDDLKPAS